VKKFLPGHYLRYDLESHTITDYEEYYDLPVTATAEKSFEEWKQATRDHVERAVERRMVADVPVACLLSGGIDSSIMTALAKRHNPDLHTYSIGFDTTNELPHAKRVAEYFDTTHHVIEFDKDDVSDYVDDVIHHMDEPIGDPAFLPIYVLSKEVAQDYKVVLSGDGGDEVFAGYNRYKLYHYGRYLRHFALFDFGNDVLKRLKAMRGKDDFEAFVEVIRLFDESELEELGLDEYTARALWHEQFDEPLSNAQLFDINTLLPNDFFLKADKMSSAWGLEQRVPFLDHELVEFAFTMPVKHKLKGWNEKHVLKEAFRDVIPKDIIERRKHGFDVPIDYWFKDDLGVELEALLQKSNHGLYNKGPVFDLLDDIRDSGDNYQLNFLLAQKLWSIYVFEKWYEQVIA
jgi:asparagine synthase (glutamine-hydrolysing)